MPRVLVAGATGYLGGFLVAAAKQRGYVVRALTRSESKVAKMAASIDEVRVGEVTDPATLVNIAEGVDVVVSAIGITRQKDGLTYQDVDYMGNLNLLKEAQRTGVRKFVYVSVLHAEQMRDLKIVQAKEQFVDELRRSGIDFCVIRPNGYFSDMRAFLDMAKAGRVYLFGRGDLRINPISGRDVARRCFDAMELNDSELSFGGPATMTHREIADEAFRVLNKPTKITCIPLFVAAVLLWVVRHCTPVRIYGPIEFTLTVITRNMLGEPFGKENLGDYFRDEAMRGTIRPPQQADPGHP